MFLNRKAMVLACAIAAFQSNSPQADTGFKIDATVMEVVGQVGGLRIRDLSVGESGLIHQYSLGMCARDGVLLISSISTLDTKPNTYSYLYNVLREPDNAVTITFSSKGKSPDHEGVERAIVNIVSTDGCDKIEKIDVPLFKVKSFLGTTSLRELVSTLKGKTEMGAKEPTKEGGAESSPNSEWLILRTRSPIDDSLGVTLMKSTDIGNQSLVLRCKENKTDVYIATSDYLGDESENVITRYDDERASTKKWSLSTDRKALFVPAPIPEIKRMMEAKKLTVRYDVYNGSQRTVTFSLSNLSEKAQVLRGACNW